MVRAPAPEPGLRFCRLSCLRARGAGDVLTTGGAGCSTVPPPTATGPYLHCPGQRLEEYRTQFSVYSIAASPLIVATDIRNMTGTMRSVLLNPEVLAVNQLASQAGDVVGSVASAGGHAQVWARSIAGGSGLYAAIVNFDDRPRPSAITVPFAMLNAGWGDQTKLTVRDLWVRRDLGELVGRVRVELAPHDTAMLRLSQ